MAERYRIPVPENMSIVDVQELYWPQYFGATSGIDAELIQSMGMLSMNPMDQGILNVYSDIQKSSITLFLTELLFRSIKEENSNPELFNFPSM